MRDRSPRDTQLLKSETIVVVGGGHASGQAISSLRRNGFDGRIVLVGDEPYLPYQRPPLSKKYLAGKLSQERLYFKPLAFYDEHSIDLRLGTRVTGIDRPANTVLLDDGQALRYDKLLLSTGSHVRRVDWPGSDLAGVHYLRRISDVDAIRPGLQKGARVVIVGGGYIGLEVAAVAVQLGAEVTVLEVEERVLARVVSPEVSRFFEDAHHKRGVSIQVQTAVSGFDGSAEVREVIAADGRCYPADLVVIAIGISPTIDLAAEAGLACDDGIVVDEYARTADPRVFAAGDCTRHPNPILGRRIRLESVHNALEQSKTAAASLCDLDQAYSQVPWFWSDQYDLKLQIVGLAGGYDQSVVRGDPQQDSFAAFYLRAGVLIAVDCVNRPREFMLSKKLIAAAVVPQPDELADDAGNFKELAQKYL